MRTSKRRQGPARLLLPCSLLICSLLALAACASTVQRAAPTSAPCQGADCAAGPGVSGVQLFVEPEARAVPVLAAIRGASHSIWIEMYLLTNLDVIDALEDASRCGVETRILLEMNPYGAGDVSPQILSEKLTAAGVQVRPANPVFTFTHDKLMVFDNATAYIMECNS
jgi:cardiolipin synthase